MIFVPEAALVGHNIKNQPNSLMRTIKIDNKVGIDELKFAARDKSKQSVALSGTFRSLVNNMVTGVVDGFEKKSAKSSKLGSPRKCSRFSSR